MNSDGEPHREVMIGPLTPGPLGEQVLDLAATGRAGLSALLGDAAQRHGLFRRNMRADRFLVATVNGAMAGYASLKHGGTGPFNPSLADFRRVYGGLAGLHVFGVFSCIEARSRALPGGVYLYGIDTEERFRRQGVGTALLRAALSATEGLGFARLEWETRAPAMLALTQRVGGQPVLPARGILARLLAATAADYRRFSITVRPG